VDVIADTVEDAMALPFQDDAVKGERLGEGR
jgi:hypothetical protein